MNYEQRLNRLGIITIPTDSDDLTDYGVADGLFIGAVDKSAFYEYDMLSGLKATADGGTTSWDNIGKTLMIIDQYVYNSLQTSAGNMLELVDGSLTFDAEPSPLSQASGVTASVEVFAMKKGMQLFAIPPGGMGHLIANEFNSNGSVTEDNITLTYTDGIVTLEVDGETFNPNGEDNAQVSDFVFNIIVTYYRQDTPPQPLREYKIGRVGRVGELLLYGTNVYYVVEEHILEETPDFNKVDTAGIVFPFEL